MKVAGLFVGVSKLADPGIRELQFAHRDATVLHAVFADANNELRAPPEMCRVIVNEAATRTSVLEALEATIEDANASRADVVVVHFSCHGSPSGTLVLHDTERVEVDATGLPVRTLIDTLSTVRNRPVVLTLDCCFAGVALGLTESPNRDAFNSLMHGFEDRSRIVGCAAEFGQSAFEDRELGKGFFSHALWSRLQETFDSGNQQLSAFDWIQDAVRRTTDLAQTRGRAQAATAFVTVRDDRMLLHVARVRPNQLRLIVPADLPPVTEDVASLSAHGLDEATIQALRTRLGPAGALNQLQREAVEVGGVLRQQSVFVRAPTSGGKTLVAELAILGHQSGGRKAVVLLPLRALAREHARTFSSAYSALGLRVIVSTGDAHDEDDLLIRGQFEVAFLTFEKFCAIISARPELRDSIGVVVFDELQTIADVGRGHTLELLLVQIRRWREASQWPQVVVLCGELADLTNLQRWLGFQVIASTKRPVPLEEGLLRTSTGEVYLLNRESQTARQEVWSAAVSNPSASDDRVRRRNAALPVIRKLLGDGMQVLVFCSEKPQARRMAQQLAQTSYLTCADRLVAKLQGLDASTDHRTRAILLEIAKGGVGLHVADLTDEERNSVEDAFRDRELRVLVATSTLGQGVNLPADAVVFVDDVRWDGQTKTSVPLTAVDYRNAAGRAGRLIANGPSRGLSVLIALSQYSESEMKARYLTAQSTPLGSTLGDLPSEDLVMLLLRQFDDATVNDLTAALAGTYWAVEEPVDTRWRRARRADMEASLDRLAAADLVIRSTDTEWRLTPIGRVAAGYGLSWLSAVAVADGVRSLKQAAEPVDVLSVLALALSTVEIKDIWCPNNPLSVVTMPGAPKNFRTRPTSWAVVVGGDGPAIVSDQLHKLQAISMWLSGKVLRDVEIFFARGRTEDAAAGQFFHLVHRIGALLPAIAAIVKLASLLPEDELRELIRRLTLQLSIGGGKDAASLHRLRLGLTRGQCLKLVEMGIRDLAGLRGSLHSRQDELEALLSTPVIQRLMATISDRRYQARMAAPEPQLALEGFD